MPLELANLLKPEIAAMAAANDGEGLREACAELHGADLVSVYDYLEPERRLPFLEALSAAQQVLLFEYLAPDIQEALVDDLSPKARVSILNGLSADDRAAFFNRLEPSHAQTLLKELRPDKRELTLSALRHEEMTAGRIMTPEYLVIRAQDTVDVALAKIRKEAGYVETVYVTYVVDAQGRLVGAVSLRDLLRAKSDDLIDSIMTVNPVHALVTTDQEELADTLKRYDLIALPIAEENGKLVGIVTFDDIHDIVDKEASEDILRMHGVAAQTDSYFDAPIRSKLVQRLVVLASMATVSIVSVLLQHEYNYLIGEASILAVYLTLLAGSSGNCGTQMAGIVIRAQAVAEIDRKRFIRLLARETVVGVLMALVMAGIAAALVWIRGAEAQALGGHSVATIAVTVGTAMFAALTTINLLGGIFPVLVKRVGLDPAITAGPFITTTADIMTVLLYFNIAALILHHT